MYMMNGRALDKDDVMRWLIARVADHDEAAAAACRLGAKVSIKMRAQDYSRVVDGHVVAFKRSMRPDLLIIVIEGHDACEIGVIRGHWISRELMTHLSLRMGWSFDYVCR
jgi:hypothetical protein